MIPIFIIIRGMQREIVRKSLRNRWGFQGMPNTLNDRPMINDLPTVLPMVLPTVLPTVLQMVLPMVLPTILPTVLPTVLQTVFR
jgi:hypothetical protein